jgi:hypothetical protein
MLEEMENEGHDIVDWHLINQVSGAIAFVF